MLSPFNSLLFVKEQCPFLLNFLCTNLVFNYFKIAPHVLLDWCPHEEFRVSLFSLKELSFFPAMERMCVMEKLAVGTTHTGITVAHAIEDRNSLLQI